MELNKDWRLESDNLNVTISKRKRPKLKDGQQPPDYWTAMGYFANPKNALDWLVLHKVMGSGMKDLETVVAQIDELHDIIQPLKNLPEIPRETVSGTIP